MTTFKKAVVKLHLWLGLASGLVVFVVSLTGAIFVFQDEIRDATQSWRKVEAAATAALPPSRLQVAAERHHPELTASWVIYMGPDRSTIVYGTDKTGGSYAVFFDPYTGRELHYQNLERDFFTIVQHLHMYLLLPTAIGEWVVGIGVSIFVVMLVTGIILWWPRRKTDRRRSFTIKWAGRWRRVNYDLHNVLGFYAASIALALAITGLMMSYEWVRDAVYLTTNVGQDFPVEKIPPSVPTQVAAPASRPLIDQFYAQVRRGSPTAEMLHLAAPGPADQPVYAIAYQRALFYDHRDEYYFHPATARLLKVIPHTSKSRGQKLIDANYDIHTGQILGLGGKIVAFLVSLISASLPVTGTLVWWGRRNKPKKEKRHLQAVQASLL
ncbi:PepSY-associated TM helix domain protein [Hymenobacter roseosalivarius DSM 11622]|uniref:PepSY-associated TM helix domain protein n=1 Tax=Hymenobacter roseosalivarius DSM 11622 TaxID=645990 RepID=A0A1W1UWA5_9BACT|nr:PepSY-associated TM helix domain-containing protein [Hymenobacter roseosalivarius]SMB85445.1 PepSY-associated TM helix domain protein [Hymenobacter roseosalivarius DSM 11622]